ncbi:MAG: MoaD/ThiS family protein [Verrucomicrobia bacterium]|nr:MoaD/ThiS family protein [Verrucomicrobiota bacterium]
MACDKMSLPIDERRPLIDVVKSAPALAPILEHKDALLVSVNFNLSHFDTVLEDGDEVAFLPPFREGEHRPAPK